VISVERYKKNDNWYKHDKWLNLVVAIVVLVPFIFIRNVMFAYLYVELPLLYLERKKQKTKYKFFLLINITKQSRIIF
jgi:type IV secretory pathway VirB3-like protein